MSFPAVRDLSPERMDDPACCPKQLLRTVDQFALINRLFSRYRTILRRHVLKVMQREPGRTYRLVDLGAGGCDIGVWLLAEARRLDLRLEIYAYEPDARIADHARRTHRGVASLHIMGHDALDPDAVRPCDFVFANHFLHHLSDDQIVALLRLWCPVARHVLLFSDLQRDRLSYVGYGLFSTLLRGSFARSDGLHSIRRGFRRVELGDMARHAGVTAVVDSLWPGRLVLRVVGTESSEVEPSARVA